MCQGDPGCQPHGFRLSTWLRAIPSSPAVPLDTVATTGHMATASAWQGAGQGPPLPAQGRGATGASVSPQDRGVSPAHKGHHRQPQARAWPLSSVAASPQSRGARWHSATSQRPTPCRGVALGWPEPIPAPAPARKPENTIHSRRRQQLPEHPGTGVSEGQGCRAMPVGRGGASGAGAQPGVPVGASAGLGMPLGAGAGEAEDGTGPAFSQRKKSGPH